MSHKATTIEEKTALLDSLRAKLQQFVDGGGDLKSGAAAPLGVEFLKACADLVKEFGYELAEERSSDEFLKLFAFKKKRELEKYCRDTVINSDDLAAFIMECESTGLPFLHQIHYRDHVPEHLNPTDEDLAALAANPVGSLQPGALKAVRKLGQIFRDRRYLVGHIFYLPDLSEWHFFQFDQRDIEDERGNHWKEGAHIHFLNWLWPNYDAETLWASFTTGKVKLNDSLHVRYSDTTRRKTK